MKSFASRRRVSNVGCDKQKPHRPEKPPYALAPRLRNIPDDDPKPRVNTDYRKPPKQLMGRRKTKKI